MCSIVKLTVQSSVSMTLSVVGDRTGPSSSSGRLTGLSADLLFAASLCSACAKRPLCSASSRSVASLGPDLSGCFSLSPDGEPSLRLLAIARLTTARELRMVEGRNGGGEGEALGPKLSYLHWQTHEPSKRQEQAKPGIFFYWIHLKKMPAASRACQAENDLMSGISKRGVPSIGWHRANEKVVFPRINMKQ